MINQFHIAFLIVCLGAIAQCTVSAQPELTNTEATNIDTATERGAWHAALDSLGEVKSGDFTAAKQTAYVVVANATVTDPTPPVEGEGYSVYVRNGTATVGGTGYSTVGTIIFRTFHSGSWGTTASLPYDPSNVTITGGTITGITDLAVADGGTGASTAGGALTNLGVSAFGQTLIDDATAGDALTTLGVSAYAQTILDDASAAAAATTLGLGTGDSVTHSTLEVTGDLTVDTDTLFVDASTDRVGINASETPAAPLHVIDAGGEVARFGYDASNYGSINITSGGDLEFTASGDEIDYHRNAGKDVFFDIAQNNDGFDSTVRIGVQASSATNKLILYDNLSEAITLNSATGTLSFGANSGTWDGSIIAGDQSFIGLIDAGGGIDAGTGAFTVDAGTGNTTVANDLTVGNNTLFVDASTNRVGIGTASPGESLEVANGNLLISQADAQLQFAPRSAQNITQFIDSDVSDNLVIATLSAGKNIYFGGYTGYRMSSASLSVGTGNDLQFDDGGSWDGATIAGDQDFTGQVELTNQAASSDDSAMTRRLNDDRKALVYLNSAYNFDMDAERWYNTTNGSGTFPLGPTVGLRLETGATTGSYSYCNSANQTVINWQAATGDGRGIVDWSLPTTFAVKFWGSSITGANTTARFMLGVAYNESAPADLVASNRGIGIKIEAGDIKVQVCDGTSVSTTDTGQNITDLYETDVALRSDGSGNWECWINGSQAATGTGAPTGNGSTLDNGMAISVENGAGTDNARLRITQVKTIQIP